MSKILHKRSNTASKVPLPADLDLGELAVNTADGKVFLKKGDGNVIDIANDATKATLNTSNTFYGRQIAAKDQQTNYGTAALEVQSSNGDVHISLHSAGASATSIKHTRGVQGISVVNEVGSLAPVKASSFVAGSGVEASGSVGFGSTTYEANTRNPIWRFMNSPGYGFSYFQGSVGKNNIDTIGFHFGDPYVTSDTSQFAIRGDGWTFAKGVSQAAGFHSTGGGDVTMQAGTNGDMGDLVWLNNAGSEIHRIYDNGLGSALLYRNQVGVAYKMIHAGNVNDYSVGAPSGESRLYSNSNVDALNITGFFRGEFNANAPDTGWWYYTVESHNNVGAGVAGWTMQRATAFGAGNDYPAGTQLIRWRIGTAAWVPWQYPVSQNFGGIGPSRTMQKRAGHRANGSPGLNSLVDSPAEYGFSYAADGSMSGPYLHFGGLNELLGRYTAQFSLNYNTNATTFRFRTSNGDAGGVWNSWHDVWHTGNMLVSETADAGSIVKRNPSGYLFGNYINMTDDGNPGGNGTAVSAIITKRGDNYYRSTNADAVRNFLAYHGGLIRTDRVDKATFVGHAWELSWKHYGNGHTIFDASEGTSPNGSAISKRDSQNVWSDTYPTLMGWNGTNTYGVRVDSARVADVVHQTTFGNVGTAGPGFGSYGSMNVAGQNSGYSGISFSDFNMALMMNGTYSGVYRNNSTWDWLWAGGVLEVGTIPVARLSGTVAYATSANSSTYLQGYNLSFGADANHVALRDGSGYLTAASFNGAHTFSTNVNDNFAWNGHTVAHYGMSVRNGYNCVSGYNGIPMFTNGAERAHLHSTGFNVYGTIYASGDITAFSDESVKTNWRPVADNFVARWAGVKSGIYDRTDMVLTQAGLSAQSVQAIMPEVTPTVNNKLSLNYGAAAAVATVEIAKKVMEQEKKIDDLTALVNSLIEQLKETNK